MPAPRGSDDRRESPPRTVFLKEKVVLKENKDAAVRTVLEEEPVVVEVDETTAELPPVMVMDGNGVPALLPPEGTSLIPEVRITLTTDQADMLTETIRTSDWGNVDRYKETSLEARAERTRAMIEQDADERDDPTFKERLEAFNQKEKFKRALWDTRLIRSLIDAQVDEQTVALGTAMNGSHGGSSASRLVEAEQGAGEAEASHPNFLQRARALHCDPRPDSDGSSSAPSNEQRFECWRTHLME